MAGEIKDGGLWRIGSTVSEYRVQVDRWLESPTGVNEIKSLSHVFEQTPVSGRNQDDGHEFDSCVL